MSTGVVAPNKVLKKKKSKKISHSKEKRSQKKTVSRKKAALGCVGETESNSSTEDGPAEKIQLPNGNEPLGQDEPDMEGEGPKEDEPPERGVPANKDKTRNRGESTKDDSSDEDASTMATDDDSSSMEITNVLGDPWIFKRFFKRIVIRLGRIMALLKKTLKEFKSLVCKGKMQMGNNIRKVSFNRAAKKTPKKRRT